MSSAVSPAKDTLLEIDLEATDEIDLEESATSPSTGLGLSVPASSPMGRTPSSSSSVSGSGSSTGASGVRARAAMWETKPSTPPPSSRPVGRKRSGTTTARPGVAGRLNGAAAVGSRAGASSPNGAPRSPSGSLFSVAASPPSSFKSAIPTISAVGETSPAKSTTSGLKTLKLGAARASPTTSPAASTPPVPAITEETPPATVERVYSRSPRLSPANGNGVATSPLSTSSIISPSPQSVYEDLPNSSPTIGVITPLEEKNTVLSETMTRGGLASTASELDTVFLSPVDLNDPPVDTEEPKPIASKPSPKASPKVPSRPLTPESRVRTPETKMLELVPEAPPTPDDALDLKLETIDLDGPTHPDDDVADRSFSTMYSRDDQYSKHSVETDPTEPETIVTPASHVREPSTLSDRAVAAPSTEAALLFATSDAPSSAALTDVTLAPNATATPVSPAGPTRMASLFTRVLDYGKQAEAKKETASPADDKKIPEPPRKQAQNAGGKSFFTSAASAASSFSFNLPSLPIRNALPQDSPAAEHSQPIMKPMESPSTLSEPKPASNWRATMTQFLSSRGSAGTNASAAAVSSTSSSSTNLLLHRLDDPTSARDRRMSRELGGGDKLREGFERVRNEMEGAARDIRREIARGDDVQDADGIDWSFWGTVVQDYEAVARERPKELSKAIQQGIPTVIRGPIWQLMSSSKSSDLEETYKALLKQTSPHEKAIQKDLSRTFPNHKFFKQTGQGQDGLFMVVKAYSLYDPEVGYTQGLAFIVATLLLNMPDEEAFCVLVRLMDSYNLRSHYLADMPGLQLRLYQFDRLLEEVLPLLHSHLTRKGIKSSMYASQWLMTLFSYRFPLSLVYRVFDIVLAEGIEAIFRFAIALLKKSEDDLLKLEFEDILSVLQGDLFEVYHTVETEKSDVDSIRESEWLTNDFVRDAYAVHITPIMLDHFEAEWDEKCRAQTEHLRELDQLRTANRHLSGQVKTLESSLSTMNQEHVELVRQLVLAKIAKEDMENELVKYKAMCARLSQQHIDEDSSSGPHSSKKASVASGLNLYAVRSNGSGRGGARSGSNSPVHNSPLPSPRLG